MTIAAVIPTAIRGYATITMSRHQTAQGPILRHLRDGRVVIDSGCGEITGHPINTGAGARKLRDRAAAMWLPLFAGLH